MAWRIRRCAVERHGHGDTFFEVSGIMAKMGIDAQKTYLHSSSGQPHVNHTEAVDVLTLCRATMVASRPCCSSFSFLILL